MKNKFQINDVVKNIHTGELFTITAVPDESKRLKYFDHQTYYEYSSIADNKHYFRIKTAMESGKYIKHEHD